MTQRLLSILWPSFLMAGVLEILVFAVLDPSDMRWFGGPPVEMSRMAIYTVTFLIFWGVISVSGAITSLLSASAEDINAGAARR
jgi:hypothetical protein